MSAAMYRLRIGEFKALIAKDGTPGPLALHGMMDPLPAELTENSIEMLGGLLVVDTPGGRILVDAGNGPHRGPRAHEAEAALAAEGIDPASIDVVLITHGDFDHIGGLIDAKGRLTYPNARYVLHRDLRDFWHDAEARSGYPAEAVKLWDRLLPPLVSAVEAQGTIVEFEREVVPGVRAIPALGHRVGHAIYRFESDGESLLHIGDAAVHPVFLERTDVLNLRHDTDEKRARDARRMISERAAAEDTLVVGTHFLLPGIGRLAKIAEDRYRWLPIEDAAERTDDD
jgi:glyoxylase-like metal-dependent hydrolase (beta-lactamase superfamily II)